MEKEKWSERGRSLQEGDDRSGRLMLYNLYLTQALTLFAAAVVFLFQRSNPLHLLDKPGVMDVLLWGVGFGLLVLAADFLVGGWIPEDVADDGGINELLFAERPFWHIAVMAMVVALSEELLFRGAIQSAWGPYWTSVFFAAIHIRYLKHWLMTGMVFSISYGLGWIYLRTGTLWTPVAAHFTIDFIMGCTIHLKHIRSGGKVSG